jgi:methionyl-tRNA formyltransferase
MKGKSLRIVFMGTPDFAVESLRALVENGYNIVGVVTAPDKPAGRGQKLSQSAVKAYAVSVGLNILQPEKLKSAEFLDQLKELNPDLQVVVAFRMLPEVVWALPPIGTFNLHASLLPRYRGAAPINHAIINGDTVTGVSTFMLQHEIDTGNIIFQQEVGILPDDTAGLLHDKLMAVGKELVMKTIDALAAGSVQLISQETLFEKGILPLHAPKIFKENCLVDWDNSVETIRNVVRGLSPYPAAWAKLKKADSEEVLTMKIFQASVEMADVSDNVGSIVTDNKTFLKVKARNGFVLINELQLAGKKKMQVDEFLRGFQQIGQYQFVN